MHRNERRGDGGKPDLRDILIKQAIVGDGAMGTYLYQLGVPIGVCAEELNHTRPEVIRDVHRQYYEAGARLIETNTFAANRHKLARHGLEGDVELLNRVGVALARGSVGADAYVAGSVGSARPAHRVPVTDEEAEAAYAEQMSALLTEGVDALLLETFSDADDAAMAVRVARRLTDRPVICQLAIESGGVAADGRSLDDAFARLRDVGADVVGLNCHSGPYGIIRALERLTRRGDFPLSIFPNAGLPAYVDGTFSYPAGPEYFGESALTLARLGARIVGGCCGTTPAHIAAVAKSLASFSPSDETSVEAAPPARETVSVRESAEPPEPPRREPSILDMVKERHTVIVELDPPRDLNIDKFMKGAEALHGAGADAITMADNSLAMTRMSNSALAFLIKERLGARPLVHIACRDRNLIGTQSHLMGLHATGIDHVLAITGDPARFGDLPGASSVYDVTSFQIIKMIKQMNEGLAFSGKPMKEKANFLVGTALNPNVKHLHKAVERLEKKIEAGADYAMTQPVYDPELIVKLHEATKHLDFPIFLGIMPFTSGRNAEYLHNEVPGITLSDDVRRRMAGLEGEAGRQASLGISKELLDVAMERFKGIYLITPFMAYEMTVELTKYVRERAGSRFPLVPTREMK
ncbi:bifunctional homocysteine S-methyltransferase/methylenetetrahydrofolate reductase [Paenibacillus sp.]|uniref:bifunctional homocysteine S-methyltransferase/methylenetetrahydrofolate reductase n=1 Tax=Paenibacillus sp. TaxID=58172 RepID=UPI00281143E6|nr:bifunctional homocysteine S-methyltransferase/methylenetetrahydrofolate reductase [Paenibacillus sp.]